MKLRIRHLESKETLKIEVPDGCTVQQLKAVVCPRISTASPVSPDGLFLSLNRHDELSGSSLRSLGVTSGDLIFYSVKIPNPSASSSQSMDAQVDDSVKLSAQDDREVESVKVVDVQSMELDARVGPTGNSVDARKIKALDSNAHEGETGTPTLWGSENGMNLSQGYENSGGVAKGFQDMEVVKDEVSEDESLLFGKSSFSVPSFLRKVFENEVGGISSGNECNDHKLLVIAVHAALLESGFVGYDPPSKTKVDGFRFPDRWPYTVLYYTTPEVLSFEVFETVILKFQCLGKFLNVIGSSSKKKYLHRVSLNASRFTPALNFFWKDGDSIESQCQIGVSGVTKFKLEKEVFELWKTVKDGVALPLLMDLCENAGLPLPSCFIQLPTELKIKILEMLPGVDIAKVACVCSELRFLSSNNDLWRQKYQEEFGADTVSLQIEGKVKFIRSWKTRKKAKMALPTRLGGHGSWMRIPRFPMLRRDPLATPYPFWGALREEDNYRFSQLLGLPSQHYGPTYKPSSCFLGSSPNVQ